MPFKIPFVFKDAHLYQHCASTESLQQFHVMQGLPYLKVGLPLDM